jgi:hypothetical protein
VSDHNDQREDLYAADKARAAADAMRESLAGDVRRVLVQLRSNVTMRERDIAKGTASLTLMMRAGLISTGRRIADEGDVPVYHLTQYGRLRLDADESRYGIAPLTGNLSDVLVKPHVHSVADQQHAHAITDPSGAHSNSLHTPSHSHGITDSGHSQSLSCGPASPSWGRPTYRRGLALHDAETHELVGWMGPDDSGLTVGYPPEWTAHSHTAQVIDGGHSQTLHTGEHSYFRGVTGPGRAHHLHVSSEGQHTHGVSGPRDYMKPGATYVRGNQVYCAETHQSIGPTGNRGPVCDPGLPTHNPAPTAENGPLRVRLYADGAMVIDNPHLPLKVFPVPYSDTDKTPPVTMTLDAALGKNLSLFVKTIAKE